MPPGSSRRGRWCRAIERPPVCARTACSGRPPLLVTQPQKRQWRAGRPPLAAAAAVAAGGSGMGRAGLQGRVGGSRGVGSVIRDVTCLRAFAAPI